MAEKIARRAHKGQYRRNGMTPYIKHPQRIVKEISRDDHAKAVAWLHDVLEDTDVTADDLIAEGIPEVVVTAVQALTKQKGLSYQDYLQRVKSNKLARKVKIYDMLDNLADSPTERQIKKYLGGLMYLAEEEVEPASDPKNMP
ncbi:hypothetical protein MLD52_00225 [Puniceicoccaceae bacterium K14]|nr:hypothetical protein [Puniceicoccaceae bacterium K14]